MNIRQLIENLCDADHQMTERSLFTIEELIELRNEEVLEEEEMT